MVLGCMITIISSIAFPMMADGATGDGGVPPLRRGRSRQYFVLGASIAAACCVGILAAWSAVGRKGYPAELLTVGDAYADVYRQVSA
jgi:hypothetical protein